MAWKKIAEKGEVSSGQGKAFKIDGKQIAVFNQDGFHAMDDLCVHQDGSIAPGKLEGDIVECPLHFWHLKESMSMHGMDNLSKTMIGVLIKYSNINQLF